MGKGRVRVTTLPATLDATYGGIEVDPWGGIRAGASAVTEIDREDFGITWNRLAEAGSLIAPPGPEASEARL